MISNLKSLLLLWALWVQQAASVLIRDTLANASETESTSATVDTPSDPSTWCKGLIHRMQSDRSGSSLGGMLRHKILAYRLGLKYYGAFRGEAPGNVTPPVCGREQYLGSVSAVQDHASYSELAVPECAAWMFLGLPPEVEEVPQLTHVFDTPEDLVRGIKKIQASQPHANFQLNSGDKDGFYNNIREYVGQPTQEERRMLRKSIQTTTPTLWSSKAKLKVAVHVRRGDLFICQTCTNLLPNSHYTDAIQQIQNNIAEGVEVVVFSSSPFSSSKVGFRMADWTRLKGKVKLRIDGPIIEAWNHIMQADLFLHGGSSFSALPLELAQENILGIDVQTSIKWTDADWTSHLMPLVKTLGISLDSAP